MKKTIAILIFFSVVMSVHFACKKKESTPEPAVDPYTYSGDLQGSLDISLANMMISDIDMMCSYAAESSFPKLFLPAANASGTVSTSNDTVAKYLKVAYVNTKCVDGKTRNGTIFMTYFSSVPPGRFYRDFGFVGKISLANFTTDGWAIENVDGGQITVTNLVSPVNYDPAKTNLSWQISGKLKFINLADSTKNMTWDGQLTKTLVNTNDPSVFNPNKKSAIQWPFAVVNYMGSAGGVVSADVAYNFYVGSVPIKRDFTCNFIPGNNTDITQFHPFINGIVVFKSSNFHPRAINYGPQDPGLCDNKGTIAFKDETHDVDFE